MKDTEHNLIKKRKWKELMKRERIKLDWIIGNMHPRVILDLHYAP